MKIVENNFYEERRIMASCSLCGKNISFMGGGREPYTGKDLYICNECGELLKKLDMYGKEGNIEQFRIVNIQLQELSKESNNRDIIQDFASLVERKILYKKKKDAEEEQLKENKKIILQQYEQLSATFLSTTGYNFEGYIIEEYLGIVDGQAVLGTGVLSEIFANISDTFGTESNAFSKKMREAKKLAFDDMQKEALYKGANAIIGLDIDITTIGNNMIAVSANATAVKIKKMDKKI